MLPQRREDEDADEQVQEGDPLAPEAHPDPNIFPPISIKLRTAELRISKLLEGTGRLVASICPAVGPHRFTHGRYDHFPGDVFTKGQHQPRRCPLEDLSCFEQATSWIVPAPLQCDPMLHQQAQQLSIQLGQYPLWLAAPPGINLAFLFAELPKSSLCQRRRIKATTYSAESMEASRFSAEVREK